MFEKALKIAIKAGYRGDTISVNKMPNASILQDPLFWQALGRGLGWSEYTSIKLGNWDEVSSMVVDNKLTWQLYALRYFDTLMSGKSEEEFWKSLIKEKI